MATAEQNLLLSNFRGEMHVVNEQLAVALSAATSDDAEPDGQKQRYILSLELRLQATLAELQSRELAHVHSVAELEMLRADLETCNKVYSPSYRNAIPSTTYTAA